MVNYPFDINSGIQGLISWIALSTDGWFFIFFFIAFFIIVYIPLVRIWGHTKSFFATSFGIFLLSIPIYYLHGLSDRSEFVIIVIFVISVVKILTEKP